MHPYQPWSRRKADRLSRSKLWDPSLPSGTGNQRPSGQVLPWSTCSSRSLRKRAPDAHGSSSSSSWATPHSPFASRKTGSPSTRPSSSRSHGSFHSEETKKKKKKEKFRSSDRKLQRLDSFRCSRHLWTDGWDRSFLRCKLPRLGGKSRAVTVKEPSGEEETDWERKERERRKKNRSKEQEKSRDCTANEGEMRMEIFCSPPPFLGTFTTCD